jgi:hypothetical protein
MSPFPSHIIQQNKLSMCKTKNKHSNTRSSIIFS